MKKGDYTMNADLRDAKSLRQKIRFILSEADEPVHYKEIAEMPGFEKFSASTIAVVLSKMTKKDEVTRHGNGYYSLRVITEDEAPKKKDLAFNSVEGISEVSDVIEQMVKHGTGISGISHSHVQKAETALWTFMRQQALDILMEKVVDSAALSEMQLTQSFAFTLFQDLIHREFFKNRDIARALLAGFLIGRLGR